MSGTAYAARDVWDSLRSRPGRAGVAFAAMATGMLALALMFGVLRGVGERADALTAELGAHAAVLSAESDAGAPLTRAVLPVLRAASPAVEWSGVHQRILAPSDGAGGLIRIRTDERLAAARGWTIRLGRFLDAADVRDGSRHAVVTDAAARRWGWRLGDTVGVEDRAFVIVGILDPSSGGAVVEGVLGAGAPALLVPWTSCPADPRSASRADGLRAVYLRAPDAKTLAEARAAADRVLSAPDLRIPGSSWITPESLVAGLRRWRTGLVGGMGALAVLSLVLAATSLLGLLMSDVRNRVPEIGLRLALGATPRDIALIFFHEVAALSAAAALCAIALAAPVLARIARYAAIPLVLDPLTALAVAAASFAFGALCATAPARMAARISAAEALRND
ncbi:MAG: ABC transporter permease [Kiritimatiellae bacterium]|nr:ABC transporter permease [Kiritimatiellia bacterium]